MDFKTLTEQSLFLQSFFTDLESGLIFFDEDANSVVIEKKSQVYEEYCENLIELGLSEKDKISLAIRNRMMKTILQYYNEHACINCKQITLRWTEHR